MCSISTGWPISWWTWVGLTLIWDVPLSCPPAQPLLLNSNQPKQNRADSGTVKIQVNPKCGGIILHILVDKVDLAMPSVSSFLEMKLVNEAFVLPRLQFDSQHVSWLAFGLFGLSYNSLPSQKMMHKDSKGINGHVLRNSVLSQCKHGFRRQKFRRIPPVFEVGAQPVGMP